jgi:hypothetical protein
VAEEVHLSLESWEESSEKVVQRCGLLSSLYDLATSELAGALARQEVSNLVAVWAVGAQLLFVEEALDTTIQADAIGVATQPDRPAHLFVTASTENQHPGDFKNAVQPFAIPLASSDHVLGIRITKVSRRQPIDIK